MFCIRFQSMMLLGVFGIFAAGGCGGRNTPTASNPAPAATSPGPQTPMTEYVAPKGKFAMKYPATWQPHSDNATLMIVPKSDPESGKRTISIDVPDLPFHFGIIPMGMTKDHFIKHLKERMQEVTIDSEQDQGFFGGKGHRIHAHGKMKGNPMIVDALVAIHGDNVYIIDAETDPAGADEAHGIVEGIIASWQWK